MKTSIIMDLKNKLTGKISENDIAIVTMELSKLVDQYRVDGQTVESIDENNKLLDSFLSSKRLEGCSEKTIAYYQTTINMFFSKYNLNGKTIIPFSTHEGSRLGSVVSDLKSIYPKANFKEAFSIYGHETRKDLSKMDKWLKRLNF